MGAMFGNERSCSFGVKRTKSAGKPQNGSMPRHGGKGARENNAQGVPCML